MGQIFLKKRNHFPSLQQTATSLHHSLIKNQMIIEKLSRNFKLFLPLKFQSKSSHYRPTPFLSNHYFQSIYFINSPDIKLPFERERVFFTDGGHISLDWLGKVTNYSDRSIVVIMHGTAGGSETSYIRALAQKALQNNYICVCINGRGINSDMTSPIPFIGQSFYEFDQALKRIQAHFLKSKLQVIGTSLGGNHVLRYFLKNQVKNVKSLCLISAPFNVGHSVDNMHLLYQKFFIKSYIQNSVCRHEQMKFWWDNNIVDIKKLKNSKTIREFHQRITTKITGYEDLNQFLDLFTIKPHELEQLKLQTLILSAQDDPIVDFNTIPIEAIRKNSKIKFISTKRGGHLCWFEGCINPQRWYPKPVFEFINSIEKNPQSQAP